MNQATNPDPATEPPPPALRLSDWLTVEQLLERYGEHYKTTDSLRWALRQHQTRLLSRGAISNVGRRKLYHPERFEAAVIEGGIEAAARELAA